MAPKPVLLRRTAALRIGGDRSPALNRRLFEMRSLGVLSRYCVASTKEAAMNRYVALDVSLEFTAVCVMDEEGELVLERKVASDPAAIAGLLFELPERPVALGLEAGPLSEWLARGLAQAGLDAVLMETRHVRAALSAMVAKTDRNDARGMAQLLRMGWFRPV